MGKILSTSVSFGLYAKKPVKKLEELGHELDCMKYDPATGKRDLMEKIKNADALIVGTETVDGEVMDRALHLKIIAKHGIGVDNIDLEAAKERGVVVVNAPGTNARAVTEYTWALIMCLCRRVHESIEEAKDLKWGKVIGYELHGKTLGVIGLGKIGREVALVGRGFGMEILAFDPFLDKAFVQEHSIQSVGIEMLLRNSDIVTIHTSLNDSTYHLLNHERLGLMKQTAYLVNVARGPIIDEKALYSALHENRIAGAACDVFEKEPPGDNPLIKLHNFLPTPHTAGYTFEALEAMGLVTVENIHNVLSGKPVINRIV